MTEHRQAPRALQDQLSSLLGNRSRPCTPTLPYAPCITIIRPWYKQTNSPPRQTLPQPSTPDPPNLLARALPGRCPAEAEREGAPYVSRTGLGPTTPTAPQPARSPPPHTISSPAARHTSVCLPVCIPLLSHRTPGHSKLIDLVPTGLGPVICVFWSWWQRPKVMVACLASHALRTWDDWGCPDVRPLLPDPSSQHRPTSVLTAARLGSRPRFLDIGHARFPAASVPLRPQPSCELHAQFRPAHRLPHEVSPLRCPVPRTLQSTMPCGPVAVVHCFTSLSHPRPGT